MKCRDLLRWSSLLTTDPFLKDTTTKVEESYQIDDGELTAKESLQNSVGWIPDTRLWLYNDRIGDPFPKAR